MTNTPPESLFERMLAAVTLGNLDQVKADVQLWNPKSLDSRLLAAAAETGDVAMMAILLPISDPKASFCAPLRGAAREGHLEATQFLLPVSGNTHTTAFTGAISSAAEWGHLSVVEAMLPYTDPKQEHSSALRWAAQGGHLAIMDILLPLSDLEDAWLFSIHLKRWAAVDHLSAFMPVEALNAVLAQVPQEPLPHLRARVLNETLSTSPTSRPTKQRF